MSKKKKPSFKNGERTWMDICPDKMYRWPMSKWKDAQPSEKCKSGKQWGITLYWSEWLSSKWSQMRSVGKDVETRESQHSVAAAAAKSLQSCPTLCDPMNRSTPGLPVHHQLPEFTQIHAHRVGDAIQPSHPLSSPCPPAPNPSQHQGLFQWVNSSQEVAKVLEFQLQHQSFQWTPRTDLL